MNPVGKLKTALVTGASRGIGRAIARALAARGVRLALHYHMNDHAAAAARLWHGVAEAFGQVDILVNNAGLFLDHPPLSTAFEEWNATWLHTLAANLLGPANLSLLAAQAMAARPSAEDSWGRGRIVNISSRGAFRGEPDAPAYGASKAGLNSLSQSLAKALAARAVYVYCLAPGFVETDMAAAHLAGPGGADR